MHAIFDNFTSLGVTLDPKRIQHVEDMVILFEIRGAQPLTLNSQLLAVHPIAFLSQDRTVLFEIFGVTEQQVDTKVLNCASVNQNFITISDPFNLFCVWLLHLATYQIQDPTLRHTFMVNIAKYLHYRWFTSLINQYWRYGADESVMLATINSLSRKFDIIIYGTWRKTIEARAEDLVSPQSVHAKAIRTGQDDQAFTRVLTDTQTRIRDKVKIICRVYYDYHKQGIKINSSAATTTDLEGEKILVQRASTFDAMVTDLITILMNVHTFVDLPAIRDVSSQFSATSFDLLRITLTQMSETATRQVMTSQFSDEIKEKGQVIYIGMKPLINAVVLVSFRYCVNNKISLKNKAAVWNALRNVYSSSRVNDPDILAIKISVGRFIDTVGETSREATKSSLRLAVIMYLIYKCLKYL